LKLADFNHNKNGNKKSVDNFVNRLEAVETRKGIKNKNREPTDAEIESKFADYRHARARERHGPGLGGTLTYADLWDEVTNEEIDYYCKKALEIPPEERYQRAKKRPPYHEFAWTSRGIHNASTGYEFDYNRRYYVRKPGYNGEKACNENTGCVPNCRFYPPMGRISDDEIIARHEKWKRDRDSTTLEEKREERQRVHDYNLVYDDDTPEQRLRWQQKREKWHREHPNRQQWF